jgi:type II secretion system protein I
MKHRGFTLLEVVLGLVLLATVLVTSLMALGRQRHVLRQAQDRQLAISLADSLLTQWRQSPAGLPLRAAAPIADRLGWWWRTDVVANRTLFGRTYPVVRLQIVQRAAAASSEVVLVSVEVLQAT